LDLNTAPGVGGWHHPQSLDAIGQGVSAGQDPQTAVDKGEMGLQGRSVGHRAAGPILFGHSQMLAIRGPKRKTLGRHTKAPPLLTGPEDRTRCRCGLSVRWVV